MFSISIKSTNPLMVSINSINHQVNQVKFTYKYTLIYQYVKHKSTVNKINYDLIYQHLSYKVLYCTLCIINKYYTVRIV